MADLIAEIAKVRDRIASIKMSGTVGFVPTMGALHAGHGRLLHQARQECQGVVASIFVNPLQFDREDDLTRYPRTLEQDLEFCSAHGVDVVFAPTVAEMYPMSPACTVNVGRLGDHLCGRYRPGHFQGVATVVLKLLDIVQPNTSYFGEKDAQQLAIIRRMVADFSLPVAVVGVPTVREPDGLAISSRNGLLGPAERNLAPALYRALCEACNRIEAGVDDVVAIKASASKRIPSDPLVRLEYLDIVNPDDMQPVERVTGPVCVAAAMWVGSTRLIDNVRCTCA